MGAITAYSVDSTGSLRDRCAGCFRLDAFFSFLDRVFSYARIAGAAQVWLHIFSENARAERRGTRASVRAVQTDSVVSRPLAEARR